MTARVCRARVPGIGSRRKPLVRHRLLAKCNTHTGAVEDHGVGRINGAQHQRPLRWSDESQQALTVATAEALRAFVLDNQATLGLNR